MAESHLAPPLLAAGMPARAAAPGDTPARLRAVVEENYDFVWRTMRHLGFRDAAADDGAQQVMCVLAKHFGRIAPGLERSFLYSTAVRVAGTLRRTARRHPDWAGEPVDAMVSHAPGADDLLQQREEQELLQRLLDALPFDLRVVIVLHEIEELSGPEVAAALGVPLGTVTSRLRRAREQFRAGVRRLQAARGE